MSREVDVATERGSPQKEGQAASLLVLEGGERKKVHHKAISEGKVAF